MKNFKKTKSNCVLEIPPLITDTQSLILECLNGSSIRFIGERKTYSRRSIGFIYNFCKHYNPKITNVEFKKALGELFKSKKLQSVYCPDANCYVIMILKYGVSLDIMQFTKTITHLNTYIIHNRYQKLEKDYFDKNKISFNCLAGLVD